VSEIDRQEAWPEWLLESYGKLSLPSLYDYLLNQEKLAAEIRKQNKELRVHSEALKSMQNSVGEVLDQLKEVVVYQHNLETTSRESDEQREESDPSVKQMQQTLIGMMDALFNLLEATAHSNETLLTIIPEWTGFWKKSKPSWRIQSEQILKGHYSGIELIRDKLLSALMDSDISVIIPQIGTLFDPNLQRAVEQVSGGESRRIAKVIRYGYQRREDILRYADVAVYQ
jgi:hypothetical protein